MKHIVNAFVGALLALCPVLMLQPLSASAQTQRSPCRLADSTAFVCAAGLNAAPPLTNLASSMTLVAGGTAGRLCSRWSSPVSLPSGTYATQVFRIGPEGGVPSGGTTTSGIGQFYTSAGAAVGTVAVGSSGNYTILTGSTTYRACATGLSVTAGTITYARGAVTIYSYDAATLCNDANPCTIDSWNGTACVYTNAAPAVTCLDDGNSCTNDYCDGSGSCTHPIVMDGAACGGGMCSAGVCAAAPCFAQASGAQPTGCNGSNDSDLNNCTTPGCNGAGSCVQTFAVGGSPACATDGNPCTSDVCGGGACTHPAVAAGTTCPTGVCNVSGTCVGCVSDNECDGATPFCQTATGTCRACTADAHCSDGNVCTSHTCNLATFTCNAPTTIAACCNVGGTNASQCGDGNACTSDLCTMPSTEFVANGNMSTGGSLTTAPTNWTAAGASSVGVGTPAAALGFSIPSSQNVTVASPAGGAFLYLYPQPSAAPTQVSQTLNGLTVGARYRLRLYYTASPDAVSSGNILTTQVRAGATTYTLGRVTP